MVLPWCNLPLLRCRAGLHCSTMVFLGGLGCLRWLRPPLGVCEWPLGIVAVISSFGDAVSLLSTVECSVILGCCVFGCVG